MKPAEDQSPAARLAEQQVEPDDEREFGIGFLELDLDFFAWYHLAQIGHHRKHRGCGILECLLDARAASNDAHVGVVFEVADGLMHDLAQ
jgi:hypothetical protein